ncbi:MAG: hypothetical protein WAM62_11420 [Pseudolabrys sp.]
MSQTIRILYKGENGRLRKNFNWNISPPITTKSVVIMSAAEAVINTSDIAGIEDATSFNLGDADVYVTNVSPHQGGVEFILHANWGSPINIAVDLTVLDPYEQFFAAN